MDDHEDQDPLASIQEILEKHKKTIEESEHAELEGRKTGDHSNPRSFSSSRDHSPTWERPPSRDHSTTRPRSRGHSMSSSRDHSTSREHSRTPSYDRDRTRSREHSSSRHSSVERTMSWRSDGSESPGPSRRDLAPEPRETDQDPVPSTSRSDDGHLEDDDTDGMRAPPVMQEPKSQESPIRDEFMSASEDDLDSDGQMIEGSPPVRREKRKRAVSDLSTESEGDLLDSPIAELPVLPITSGYLSHDHGKHKISLVKKGSLANRRKPTRQFTKRAHATPLFDTIISESVTMGEEMSEEPARPPSRASLGSPKLSPSMPRREDDGAMSLGMLIGKSPPPPVMAKPSVPGGIRMPVALPGMAGGPAPKLRSVKKPVPPPPEPKPEDAQTPAWLADTKLKKSPKPDVIPSKVEKPEEESKPKWLSGSRLHPSPPKMEEKAQTEREKREGSESPKWQSRLRRTCSQRKEAETEKCSDDEMPSWRTGLRRTASQKICSERMDSDGEADNGGVPWVGLRLTPKKEGKDEAEPKREPSPVPPWLSEAKKGKKLQTPPKEKPSSEGKSSPPWMDRLKLKKKTPTDDVESSVKKSDTQPSAMETELVVPAAEIKIERDSGSQYVPSFAMDSEPTPAPPAEAKVDVGPKLSPVSPRVDLAPQVTQPAAKINKGLDLQPPTRFKMTAGPEVSPPSQSVKVESGPEISPSAARVESGPLQQPPSDKPKPLRTVDNEQSGKGGSAAAPWMQETKVRRKKSLKDENNERVKAEGDKEPKPSWMKEVLARRRKTQEKLNIRDKTALENLAEVRDKKDKESPSQSPPLRRSSASRVVPLKTTESTNISIPSTSLSESNKNVESQNKTNVSRSRQSSIGSSVGSDHELIISFIDNQEELMKTPTKVLELDNVTSKSSSTDVSPRDKDLSPRRGNYSNGDRTGHALPDENTPPHDLRRSSDTGLYTSSFSRPQVLPPIKSPPSNQTPEKENTESIPSWKAEIAARKHARKLSLPRAEEVMKTVEIPLWKRELEERRRDRSSVIKPSAPEEDTSTSTTSSSPVPPWKLELAQRKKKTPLATKSNEPTDPTGPEPDWMKQVSERRRQRLASSGLIETIDPNSSQC